MGWLSSFLVKGGAGESLGLSDRAPGVAVAKGVNRFKRFAQPLDLTHCLKDCILQFRVQVWGVGR